MDQTSKNRVDLYPLTHVDCIEKAICSMLHEFDDSWGSFYLLYNNWTRCFDVEQGSRSEIGLLEYLCEENIFPLRFSAIKVSGESVALDAAEAVKMGGVCLIPVNLRELFYSKHFHHNDWPHLIFVRKCDSEEKLLYIVDSCQKQENEEIFSPFVMEYDKLDKIYKAYCDTFPPNMMYHNSEVFYSLSMNPGTGKIVDIAGLSGLLLEKTVSLYEGQKEKKLLESLMEDQSSYTKETKNNIESYLGDKKIKFNQMNKRKQVFYTELIHSIFPWDDELVEKMKQDLSVLIGEWNSFYRYMIANMLRKQTFDLWGRAEKCIKKEKAFLKELYQVYEESRRHSGNVQRWTCENDEAGEITVEDSVIFMQTTKDHNAWFQDEALEVLWPRESHKIDENPFRIHVKMVEGYQSQNYHAGIVVKTNDDRMYVWGNYNDECVRLSDIGVKVDLIDKSMSSLLDLHLCLRADDTSLYFVAENAKGESQEVVLDQEVVGTIKKIGIVLKTWENEYKDPMKVVFQM